MKIVRYKANGLVSYGLMSGEIITRIEGDIFNNIDGFTGAGTEKRLLGEVVLLPPVEPAKVVAIGLNYREHARELGMSLPEEPLVFLKPVSAIIATGENIEYPESSSHVDYEGELAIVIGTRARKIPREAAADYILGYTCVNDVTARDLQKKDVQFTRSKSFDTFCPMGPCVQTELDPMNAELRTYVNGELRQSSNTDDMIFDVYSIVSFVSGIMTLEPGDVISTGTPRGVGKLNRGDEVVVEIENIGRLVNTIV